MVSFRFCMQGALCPILFCRKNFQKSYCLFLNLKDTGLYYDEYLKQVIDVLETDSHFREKLQKADIEEIKVNVIK